MDQPHNPALLEILDRAARLSPQERAPFLDQACGGDTDLKAQIESLLAALNRGTDFLANPTIGHEHSASEGELVGGSLEAPGTRIGRYKLLQQIGEGGFGVVFMAEQEQPVRRTLALKVIKLGMDTKQVIARFEAERQALALMDHPNIAKVLDAGSTDSGRPFFVMELVRGTPLIEYCDKHKRSTAERLDLFIQVCHAVQHAHQKGIIHRDLKPSNVLVTVQDGRPVPKVIDFGVAKATQGRLTERTLFTEFRQLIGTPQYMSPEQADSDGAVDVDTRSDIYSLGVLLYELLTGKTPFDSKELLSKGFDAMRRAIQEQDPDTPSTRLSQMLKPELTTVAERRLTDAPQLVHTVRGDLDCIVMKCLEKDRARRYETASGLAMDIERHLNNEPVIARPASSNYRLRKMFRRNKVAVAASSAVIAALMIGFGISTVMFIREYNARQRALTQAVLSNQVIRFLEEMLGDVDTQVKLGKDTSVFRPLMSNIVKRLDREELKDQPEVEAHLRQTLGRLYSKLSDYVTAEAMFREALKVRIKLAPNGESAEVIEVMLDRSSAFAGMRGMTPEALGMARAAVAMSRKVYGEEGQPLARALNALGRILNGAGEYVEAEATFREALAIEHKWGDEKSLLAADALSGLRGVLFNRGGTQNRAESDDLKRRADEIRISLVQEDSRPQSMIDSGLMILTGTYRDITLPPGEIQDKEKGISLVREGIALASKTQSPGDRTLVSARIALARWFQQQRRFVEAEAEFRTVVTLVIKWPDWEKSNREFDLTNCLNFLAEVLSAQDRPDEMEKVRDQVLTELQSRLPLANPDLVQWRLRFAYQLQSLGKLPQAETELHELDELLRSDPDWAMSANAANVIETVLRMGVVQELLSNVPGAEAQSHREAIAMLPKIDGNPHIAVARSLSGLAYLRSDYKILANPAAGEPFYRASLELKQSILGDNDIEVARAFWSLALNLSSQRRYLEAEEMYRQSVAVRQRLPGGGEGSDMANDLMVIGGMLYKQGRFSEAEQFWRQSAAMYQRFQGLFSAESNSPLSNVIASLQHQGQWEEAAVFRKEAFTPRVAQLAQDDRRTINYPNDLASAYLDAGQYELGLPLAESTVQRARQIQLTSSDPALLVKCVDTLACLYDAAGRKNEALKLFEDNLKTAEEKLRSGNSTTLDAMRRLAWAYGRAGRLDDALSRFEKTISIRKTKVADDLDGLGWTLLRQEKYAEAETQLRAALEIRDKKAANQNAPKVEEVFPGVVGVSYELDQTSWLLDDWERFNTQSLLGAALAGQDKFGEAEPLLISGYEGLKKREARIPIPDRRNIKEAGERLVQFYEATGKSDKAEKYRVELTSVQSAQQLGSTLHDDKGQ